MSTRREGIGAAAARSLPRQTPERLLVDQAVLWINRKVTTTVDPGFAGLIEIGQYVYERFFDRDRERVGSHASCKPHSFRALAAHPALQLTRSRLHKAVQLALQEEELAAAGVGELEHVLASHRVELLRVTDVTLKLKLLRQVSRARLSVRALRSRIDERDGKRGGGEPVIVPKPVQQLARIDVERLCSEERLSSLEDADLERLRSSLEQARSSIEQMLSAVERASRTAALS